MLHKHKLWITFLHFISFFSTKGLSKQITYQLQCNFANEFWKSVEKSNWNGSPLRCDVILNNTLVNGTFVVRNY